MKFLIVSSLLYSATSLGINNQENSQLSVKSLKEIKIENEEYIYEDKAPANKAITNGQMRAQDEDRRIQVLCGGLVPISSKEKTATCNRPNGQTKLQLDLDDDFQLLD